MNTEPFILFSSGEPAGIGPDLAIELGMSATKKPIAVIADADLLIQRAHSLKQVPEIILLEPPYSSLSIKHHYSGAGKILCIPIKLNDKVQAGQLNKNNSAYVLKILDKAIELCYHKKNFSALVTGPVHKGIINEAGFSFTGHTEYLAEKTSTSRVVMMLATPGLRVTLASTHLPIKQLSQYLDKQLLIEIIEIIHRELQTHFAIQSPYIAVCGLNPHAGENGHLGSEEIDTIIPAINDCQSKNINVHGPFPADTIFNPEMMKKADTILAMYHDQGLPVLKYKGFGQAVNITLGLPFIRTSVDHGTALDLAGKAGKVNSGSLLYAIENAMLMSAHA